MDLKALKSRNRFFSFMDTHVEEIHLQNVEKCEFNSSGFKCVKKAAFGSRSDRRSGDTEPSSRSAGSKEEGQSIIFPVKAG